MRKAALLYNPLSGRRKKHRVQDVEAAAAVLRAAGVELDISPTRAASDAGAQVRMAIRDGFETIIACGGDGTVHDVLQGIAGRDAALIRMRTVLLRLLSSGLPASRSALILRSDP